jgi:hypothetical protein
VMFAGSQKVSLALSASGLKRRSGDHRNDVVEAIAPARRGFAPLSAPAHKSGHLPIKGQVIPQTKGSGRV